MLVADEPDLIDQEYADDTLLFLHYSLDVLDTIRYALEVSVLLVMHASTGTSLMASWQDQMMFPLAVREASDGLCLRLSTIWKMPRNPATWHQLFQMSVVSNSYFNQNVKVPMELPRRKKKPFLTSRKEFKKRAAAKGAESLQPPGNGLLVPELVPVALDTLKARAALLGFVLQFMLALSAIRLQAA
ncbi:hypothetical protein L7F22_066340 [Adiantum nelumboides]|nr:hypothetical protein [Adiantum nelumboides]